MKATITRTKLYTRGIIGPAWRWAYTVTVDGEPHAYQRGPGLRSTMDWLARRFPGVDVRCAWDRD